MTPEQNKLYDAMMAPVDLLLTTCENHCKENQAKAVNIIVLREFVKLIKKNYKEGFEKQ